MKREKEVPAELLAYIKYHKECTNQESFNELDIFCTLPIRLVRMKILKNKKNKEENFQMVIIPAIDVYIRDKAVLKNGFFKRDSLSFFIAGTRQAFPYGHVYASSGCICLGSIFVPSAVPEMSVLMPLETLFLHNDRNLSHGQSHLFINEKQSAAISRILDANGIKMSDLSKTVIEYPGLDIIQYDEIWNLSADVAEQKSLPDALCIMSDIYDIIFEPNKNKEEMQTEEK